MNGNISFKNLDTGYTQCTELNNLLKDNGNVLLIDLKDIINKLKIHWVGNDAMIHINNLIRLYCYLAVFINSNLEASYNAANDVIRVQTIRHMNGGTGEIGTNLIPNIEYATIPYVESTDKYYVEPAAESDLTSLRTFKDNYNEYYKLVCSKVEELFQNWLSGANRSSSENQFYELAREAERCNGYLSNAISNLDIACKNIASV